MEIRITREYVKLKGEETELLIGLSMLIKALLESGAEKALIEKAVQAGFMSDKELEKEAEKKIADFFKKLGIEV